jgi:hypothetical protein
MLMRLPKLNASYRQRIHFGHYVARRLRRAKLATLSAAITKATAELRELGRAWEDLTDGMQDVLADRDAADDHLDQAAQRARAALAGRSATATREAPYVAIFPQGMAYYTAATLDQEVERYDELRQRLAEHLPAGDEIRESTILLLDAGLPEFAAAKTAVHEAYTAESLARTRLKQATDAWTRQLERVFGALVIDLGRARANAFFPRNQARKTKVADETDDATEEPSPAG